MHRTLKAAALGMAASSFIAPEAMALDPYMWGVGGRIGTMAVPGRFPISFPTKISSYNFDDTGNENADDPNRDLDEDGEPKFTQLQKVGFDVNLEADAMYALDRYNRVGALVGGRFGKGFNDLYFMVNYDRVVYSDDTGFDILAGGYVGAGSMRFSAGDASPEILRVPHFPLRAHVMAQVRNKTQAYAFGLYGGTNVPSNHYYTDLDGTERDDVGSPFNLALYVHAGVEISVQFGDFTPPKPKPPKGKKKK